MWKLKEKLILNIEIKEEKNDKEELGQKNVKEKFNLI